LFELQQLRDLCKSILSLNRLEALAFILNQPDVQDEIIRLNQENQLKVGLYSDGTDTPDYSAGYKQLKRQLVGNIGDKMDFRLSGEFYSTFDVEVLPSGDVNIVADGRKEDLNLFDVYGIEILGLTEDSQNKLIPYFESYLVEYVADKLQSTQ
jgi:hypothetical protein